MEGVLLGFSVVGVLVLIGAGTAAIAPQKARSAQRGVTPLVYYLTNPCLMVVLVSQTDVRMVAGLYAPLALGIAWITAVVFSSLGPLALRRRRRRAAPDGSWVSAGAATGTDVAVGAMASCYVNAGNIGVPIALYMVGTTAPVVSLLLAQLLVLAPLFLTLFGLLGHSGGPSRARTILGSMLNPVTVGVLIGAVLSLLDRRPPEAIWAPVRMLGEASIPLMLLIFGMALWQERPFAVRERRVDAVVGTGCKVVVMPVVAWALAGPVLGLEGVELLGVVAMAALPTAQNVSVFAAHHGMPITVAKDVTFASSLLSLPVVLPAAWLLGMS
ncbi:AEC family transporter [Nesterenkonia suensis]